MSAPIAAKPANLFGNRQEANLRSCVKMVEQVVTDLGLDPDDNRVKTPTGQPAWGLRRGSAAIYVFLQATEGKNYIQVISPVVKVPGQDGQALLRRLLELNASTLIGAAFGVRGDDVVITADRSTADLEASEVREMISRVGAYADRFDDELVQTFGVRKHSEVPPPVPAK